MNSRIKTRIDMAQMLQERMTKTYATLLEKQELEPDTTLVKSYIKEAHVHGEETSDDVLKVARSIFKDETVSKRYGLKVRKTDEDFFFIIQCSMNQEPVTIYLDGTNSRFWFLHSMNSSTALDSLFDRIVANTPVLDHTWMPIHILEGMAGFGHLRGLGLDYDRRVLPDIDFEADTSSVEFLKMQLWGNKASDVLRILRQEGAFPHEATLSKVKIKRWLNRLDDKEFSIDDIKYDGKVTARGTSFQTHATIMQEIHRRYTDLILSIEKDFSLRWQFDEHRASVSGEPVTFSFKRPIADLERFCEHLFNTAHPFRLWGVPQFRGERVATVHAVDLHVGTPLNFEITNDFIRVYLPHGGCGNSIVRVFTNLQHYYDSLVDAIDGHERPVFEQL